MITGLAKVATSGKYSDLSGKPSLAKVATSGSYNDLSNKPSIPTTPNAYIIKTWSSGTSWYRKYSDGWIEQGGVSTGNIPMSGTMINFNTAFSNTNYQVLAQVKLNRGYNEFGLTVHNNSSSSFKAYLGGYGGGSPNFPIYWYACGY